MGERKGGREGGKRENILTVAAPTATHSFFASSKVREEELQREATVRRGIRPEERREEGRGEG